MLTVVLDNDILIKGSAYELIKEFIQAVPASTDSIGLLAASQYIVPNQLNKRIKAGECSGSALTQFEELIKYTSFLEPTEEETRIATGLGNGSIKVHQFWSN